MNKLARIVLWGIIVLIGVAGMYVVSYALLVEPEDIHVLNLGFLSRTKKASYRLGGEAAETFFVPLNELDRWVRPQVWETTPASPADIPPGTLF